MYTIIYADTTKEYLEMFYEQFDNYEDVKERYNHLMNDPSVKNIEVSISMDKIEKLAEILKARIECAEGGVKKANENKDEATRHFNIGAMNAFQSALYLLDFDSFFDDMYDIWVECKD